MARFLAWQRSLLLLTISCAVGCSPEPAAVARDPQPSLAALLGGEVAESFLRAETAREFEFPADHGPHPGFRNEWWYLTGNLDSNDGRRFGYEVTIFRFALQPGAPATDPGWRSRQVYIGHFAVSDISGDQFYVEERFARGAAGLAGAQGAPPKAWIYDWHLRYLDPAEANGHWRLQVASELTGLELRLEPLKAPVLQGEAGLSRKSQDPGNASYYYSLPRLGTSGVLRVGAEQLDVTGFSWMDREWSSSALAADQQGWDWFALQLDNGHDLMFYSLRKQDGSSDSYSAGSLVGPDGQLTTLAYDDVQIAVLDYWDSPLGGRYPHGWHIRIPDQLIDVRVRPAMAAQELDTWVRYWEGAVDVDGTHGATRVQGRGYVELTGYASDPPADQAVVSRGAVE